MKFNKGEKQKTTLTVDDIKEWLWQAYKAGSIDAVGDKYTEEILRDTFHIWMESAPILIGLLFDEVMNERVAETRVVSAHYCMKCSKQISAINPFYPFCSEECKDNA